MGESQMQLLFSLVARRADRIRGLSISGGELFHRNYQAAKRIVAHIRRHHPRIYLWGYTNGIAATSANMKELRDLGMDEIRFDLAATDYGAEIIRKIRDDAVRIFPWVTVEVPSYDQTHDWMVRRGGLKELSDIGVKQVNLAEIHVPRPTPGWPEVSPATRTFLGRRPLYEYRGLLGSGDLLLLESRPATWDILDHASEQGIAIRVNDCSRDAKTLQMFHRYVTGTYMVQAFANGPTEESLVRLRRRRTAWLALRAFVRLSGFHPRLGAAVAIGIGDARLLPFTAMGRNVRRARSSQGWLPKSLALN